MNEKINFKEFSLRKFVKNQDEKSLYEALKDPKVVRHMVSDGISKSDCDQIVSESLSHWEKYKVGSWAVEKDGVIAGWAGFKIWQEDDFELLIVLGPSYWGLGKTIYSSLIQLAKEQFHLKKITIVLPDTRSSYEYVVKKAGFESQGSVVFSDKPFQKFTLTL